MGKKPVVAIVGLIWAGMALVGCENCKNCRNKYNPSPTFPAKAGSPAVPDSAAPLPGTPTAGAGAKADTPKAADTVGTKGFSPEAPTPGLPVSTSSSLSSPMTQNALRPSDDTPPGLPGQGHEYRSGETPAPRSASPEVGMRFPRPPVTPVSSNTTETLPPISQSVLPPSPLSPTIPAAPSSPGVLPPPPLAPMIPAAPMPPSPGAGNNLPGIDPISK